jgi:hypothetical protein
MPCYIALINACPTFHRLSFAIRQRPVSALTLGCLFPNTRAILMDCFHQLRCKHFAALSHGSDEHEEQTPGELESVEGGTEEDKECEERFSARIDEEGLVQVAEGQVNKCKKGQQGEKQKSVFVRIWTNHCAGSQ